MLKIKLARTRKLTCNVVKAAEQRLIKHDSRLAMAGSRRIFLFATRSVIDPSGRISRVAGKNPAKLIKAFHSAALLNTLFSCGLNLVCPNRLQTVLLNVVWHTLKTTNCGTIYKLVERAMV